MSVFPNVKAFKVPPPYLVSVSGGRFRSVVWSESDKIWSGTLVIHLRKFYRELVLRESDSGHFFAHSYIPCHSIDLSVLDSQEHFVTHFSDGAQLLMHLGLEFGASSDARNFYRALLCQEDDGATVENVDDGDVVEGISGLNIDDDDDDEEEGEEEGESTRGETTGDEEEEEEGESTRAETSGDEERSDRKSVKDRIDNIFDELKEKKRELKEKERVLKVKEQELKVKNDKLEKLEREKGELQQQNIVLKERNDAKTNQIKKLVQQISTLKEESAAKTNQMKELEKTLTQTSQESAAKTNQIKKLVQQISTLKEESAAKTIEMKEWEKTIIQMLIGIQEKEKELQTNIDNNLSEWRTKSSAL